MVPLETAPSIYQVPLILDDAGVTDLILERLALPPADRDLQQWREWVSALRNPTVHVPIAIVGKYVELPDAYLSVKEALIHAGVEHGVAIDLRWVQSDRLEGADVAAELAGVCGLLVPGGFGERGSEGEVAAARWAREHRIPYLGLCRGMQQMVIEFARNVAGLAAANSTEFERDAGAPVISLLEEQEHVREMGGTMRLGHYPCRLIAGTRAAAAYGDELVHERHRHRWEFNNAFRELLAAAGSSRAASPRTIPSSRSSSLRDIPSCWDRSSIPSCARGPGTPTHSSRRLSRRRWRPCPSHHRRPRSRASRLRRWWDRRRNG